MHTYTPLPYFKLDSLNLRQKESISHRVSYTQTFYWFYTLKTLFSFCFRYATRDRSHLWKRNVTKSLRQKGLPYISRGIPREGRAIRKPCMPTCPYGCTTNFNESDRKEIFAHFWSLTYQEKDQYFFNHIGEIQPKRRCTEKKDDSRRTCSFIYYFDLQGVKLQVCKTFFINTLCVSSTRPYQLFRKQRNVTNK